MATYLDQHLSRRKAFADDQAEFIRKRRRRNRFFHAQVNRLVSSQVRPGARVIDVGCSDGGTLVSCLPEVGVGIDLDRSAIEMGRTEAPASCTFVESAIEHVAEAPLTEPDYVVLSMVLDEVYDIQEVLERVGAWAVPSTRFVLVTYSRLWRPALFLAEKLRLKVAVDGENYVPRSEVENLLETADFEITKRMDGVLLPFNIPVVSRFVNRWVAPLPLIRSLCLIRVTVARRKRKNPEGPQSVSIVVAARNESGHIHELIERVPLMAPRQELIFVEGGSSDDTWEVIQAAVAAAPEGAAQSLIALQQPGIGKGDAVRAGFAVATGDVLVILDADISVPPEELPKFVEALADDACEFSNGSRLVYPMEKEAMRFLNILGNKFFGYAFTYLLGQPVRDTLCGTKVLRRSDYMRIAANRSRFGDFDPFGDFDLLFGASGLGMRIRDVPVHYKERTYGSTNISRFRHGLLLLRMCGIAARRLKFIG